MRKWIVIPLFFLALNLHAVQNISLTGQHVQTIVSKEAEGKILSGRLFEQLLMSRKQSGIPVKNGFRKNERKWI